MLEYVIEKIAKAGITDIIINVNPGEVDVMRKAFGDGEKWGVHLTYVEQQGGARGIAHAVANAEPYLKGDSFVYFLGDNILLGDIRGLRETFDSKNLDCLIALARVQHPQRFGVAKFDESGALIGAVEKPEIPPSSLAITGIYFFDEQYFDAFKTMKPSARGEYEITDMIEWYLRNGRVGHEEITGWWKDTGKPEDLLEGNALLLNELRQEDAAQEGTVDPTARIQGKVAIGKGTTIGPECLIRGPVVIGAGCVIENAFVGPYTSIGDNVTIRDTEIEHSIVFDGAKISSGSRIVDAIIGKDASVTSAMVTKPRGHRLIIGDNSVVEL